MNCNVTISIICPLYNKFKYVSKTLDSVINQTYQNWELIIVDDGSDDGSCKLADKYAVRNNKIRVYKRTDYKANKGASVCRNIGIAKAKGAYIMFLDADDVLTSDALEYRMQVMARFPDIDGAIFNHGYFYNDIAQLKKKSLVKDVLDKIAYKLYSNKNAYFFKRFASYALPWTISNPVWKQELLKSIDGFNESFARLQDPELHLRILTYDKLRLQYFYYNHKETVLVRTDEDRRAFNEDQHLKNHLSSIEKFIMFFSNYFNEQHRARYLKCLRGYLLAGEQEYIFWSRRQTSNEKDAEILSMLHKNRQLAKQFGISTKSYEKVLQLIYFFSKMRIFLKLRVHTIIINLYKIRLWL